uniref:Galectin n=1 Tax=Lygus hesperus TaxID=30085 RepID=A0A0A9Y305_LYGHE
MLPVPYVGYVERPISTGVTVKIGGRCPIYAQRFNVNLQCGPSTNPRDDVAFHMSVDFYNHCLVSNDILDYRWGVQQCDFRFPFLRGEEFTIEVFCNHSRFDVLVNNHHSLSFEHRMDPSRITHLAIDGDVVLFSVEYIYGLHGSLLALNTGVSSPAGFIRPSAQASTYSTSREHPSLNPSDVQSPRTSDLHQSPYVNKERNSSQFTQSRGSNLSTPSQKNGAYYTSGFTAVTMSPRKTSTSSQKLDIRNGRPKKRGWWKCGRSSEDSD